MAIDDHMKRLRKQAEESASELAKIERLKAEFPDLDTYTDRWKNVRYMSVMANPMVNNVDIRRSCGCCPDAGVIAMPYVEFEGMRVYSNPHYLFVGAQDAYYGGVNADRDWKKQYEKAGISHHAIAEIKRYLAASAPSEDPYEDDDDDAA